MSDYKPITPPLTVRGVFEVRKPFEVLEGQVYEVVSVREFSELHYDNVDIFTQFYADHGLTEKDYRRDVANGCSIVGLEGELGIIYIPDSYILSYPSNAWGDYQHIVLSVSLGTIPSDLDLTKLKDRIRDTCVTVTGHDVKVKEHHAPTVSMIKQNEGDVLEKLRKGLLELAEDPAIEVQQLRKKLSALLKANNEILTKTLPAKKKPKK